MSKAFVLALRRGELQAPLPPKDVAGRLLRAAWEPTLRSAREELRLALGEMERRTPVAETQELFGIAATLAFALRDGELALHLCRREPLSSEAWARRLEGELALRAGWSHEALGAFEAMGGDPWARGHRLKLLRHARHWQALGAILNGSDDPGELRLLGQAQVFWGETTAALRTAEGLRDPELLLAAGAPDAALNAAASTGHDLEPRLRLWSGVQSALPWAEHVHALLRGERADPEVFPEDAEGLCWRAQALFFQGEEDAGRRCLDRALGLAGGFHFPAVLMRLGSEARDNIRDARPFDEEGRREFGAEIHRALGQLWGRDVLRECGCWADVVAAIEASLKRLGPCRAPSVTFRDDAGAWCSLGPQESPRQGSRRALELIRVEAPEVVLRAFDAVIAAHPESASPFAHRGELHLWCGDYAAAESDFRRVLAMQRGTRWGWIGLGAALMLQGDIEGSLRAQERGVAIMGGAIGSAFIYRGEARLRAGDLAGAESDLLAALQSHPTRMSTWLNLALVHEGKPELQRPWIERLMAHAPTLLEDACGWAFWDGRFDDAVLHEARRLLRGNRSSSCVTYWAGQQLRLVTRPRLEQDEGDTDAMRRKRLLAGARRRLEALLIR